MSRKTNRRQISPIRIKPNPEPRRGNYNSEVQRIINHAAKLISEYNKTELNKLMDEDLDNQLKITKLLKESKVNLPKISLLRKSKKSQMRKRKVFTVESQNLEAESKSSKGDCNVNYNSLDEAESNDSDSAGKLASQKVSTQISLPLSNETDDNVQDYSSMKSSENPITDRKSENLGTLSQLSFEKSVLCSICSTQDQAQHYNEENNKRDLNFNYEIEIKTADKDNSEKNINVFIQLYGETTSMTESISLNRTSSDQIDSNLFRPGSLDKFSISLQYYIGSIINVKIGLENEGVLWNLDYLCVRDIESQKDYFFSCRRCLGTESPDKLTQITLGYTPPYKTLKHDYLSKSNTESIENKKLDESILESEKDNISSSRSEKSHHSQINESIHLSDQILEKSYQNKNNNLHHEPSEDEIIDKSVEQFSSRPISQNSNDSCPRTDTKLSSSSSSSSNKIVNDSNQNPHRQEKINSSSSDSTDIFTAIRDHDVETVKRLRDSDNNKSDADENGCCPIHLAGICYEDKEECREIIKHLISINVDINSKSSDGLISLHYAILNNNLPAIQFLIEHCEADPSILDQNGNNSSQLANIYGFHEIVDYLANINPRKTLQIQSLESDNFNVEEETMVIDEHKSSMLKESNNNDKNDQFLPEIVSVEMKTSEYYDKDKSANIINDIDKENVETDEDKSFISENKQNSRKTSLSICSEDSKNSQKHLSPNSIILPTKHKESEKANEPKPSADNQKANLITPDDDSLENLESKQFEAENKGIMFYKEIPDPYKNKSTKKTNPSKKFKDFDDELSAISSKSNTSSVSTRLATMSPITPRSNLDSSLSSTDEIIQPKPSENSDRKHDLIASSDNKSVNDPPNLDNNEDRVDEAELEYSSTKTNENLNKKHQDHSITNGQFSSASNPS